MHIRISVILVVLFLFTECSRDKGYPIQDDLPVERAYYLKAISEINEQIARNPKDLNLRLKRLSISQKLGWPENVDADLEVLIRNTGLTFELYRYGVSYYVSHHHYENLLNITSQWEGIEGQSENTLHYRIVGLIELSRHDDAAQLMWELIQSNRTDPSSMQFVALKYLQLHDTVRAIYAFNLVYKSNPQNEVLIDRYVPILLSNGYPEEARSVLKSQKIDSSDVASRVVISKTLYELGDTRAAHDLLRGHAQPEVLMLRSEWFSEALEWDSAMYCIDLIIQNDSSIQALLAKARIQNRRGRLSSAYDLYSSVLERDATNRIAADGVRDVARKIAYLQRVHRNESTPPVLDLQSKKVTNK